MRSLYTKPYFWAAVWFLGILTLPHILSVFGIIGDGTAYLVLMSGLVLGLCLLFEKTAFRLGIIGLVTFAWLGLHLPEKAQKAVRSMEYRIRDNFFRLRGFEEPSQKVVIVDVDDKSLQALGQWPWPRTAIAAAVDRLGEDGVAAVGFDILFSEPDRLSLKHWQKRLQAAKQEKKLTPEEVKALFQSDPKGAPFYLKPLFNREKLLNEGGTFVWDNDQELAHAFRRNRVVAGALFAFQFDRGHSKDSAVLSSYIQDTSSLFPGLRLAKGQLLNIPEIQRSTYHQGFFNIIPDSSGTARFYPMLLQAKKVEAELQYDQKYENRFDPRNYVKKKITKTYTYPSLALEMYRVAGGYDQLEPRSLEGIRGFVLKRVRGFSYEPPLKSPDYTSYPQSVFIPLDFKGEMQVRFLGPGGNHKRGSEYAEEFHFPYVSIVDLIEGRVPKGFFKDKLVLIGSTDPMLSDLIGSPFGSGFPGLEIHATVLDNLITQRFLIDQPHLFRGLRYLALLLGGALFCLLISYSRAAISGSLVFLVLVGLPVISYQCMARFNVSFDFVYMWVVLAFLSIAVEMFNLLTDEKERQFITGMFEKMVSKDVLKKLADDPRGTSLKGQRVTVTVMFADLADFTTISEELDPEELVRLVNYYLTPMCRIILKNDGFIDKFIGDAIMACWGIPFYQENHAVQACRSAIEHQAKLSEMSDEIFEEFGVRLRCRIGLASGEGSAALLGSEERENYTVVGDVVNLSARLEPCCDDYKVKILIAERTYNLVKDKMVTRWVDQIIVKGKTEPIKIYELVGEKGKVPEELIEHHIKYEEAFSLYQERKWESAEQILEGMGQKDAPCEYLLKKVKEYQLSPPPPEWKGERIKTSK